LQVLVLVQCIMREFSLGSQSRGVLQKILLRRFQIRRTKAPYGVKERTLPQSIKAAFPGFEAIPGRLSKHTAQPPSASACRGSSGTLLDTLDRVCRAPPRGALTLRSSDQQILQRWPARFLFALGFSNAIKYGLRPGYNRLMVHLPQKSREVKALKEPLGYRAL